MARLRFSFDFISPYAFLAWLEIRDLAARNGATVSFEPVLFAGLLKHWGHKGPAEIPAKRDFTARQITRRSARLGVPTRWPAAHPFRPLTALRLALPAVSGSDQVEVIDAIFHAIWTEGIDGADHGALQRVLDRRGLDGAALIERTADPAVKQALLDSTDEAISRGLWGVPTVDLDGELFWGHDSLAELEATLRPDRGGRDPEAHGPAFRIETPRMQLRPFQPEDVWPLVRVVTADLPRLKPWFPWAQTAPSVDDQLAWILGRQVAYASNLDYTLGAFTRAGALIGGTGMHLRAGPDGVEFGYWIAGSHEGTGLVTEWVSGLTRLCLETLSFERSVIRCDVGNHRSRAIPERLGYRLLGVDRTHLAGDIPREVGIWELERADLPRTPSAAASVRAWDAAGRSLR